MVGKPVPVGFSVAFACLEVLVPMATDMVLLVRVTTVYPPCDMHFAYAAGIYVPLAAIKAARLTVETVFVVQWTREIMDRSHVDLLIAGQEAWNTPYPKAAWVLQLVDSTYASMLFLLRLKQRHRPNLSIPGLGNDTNSSEATKCCNRDPLKTLFWISASNFVFPVVLDVALLVIAFRDPSFLTGAYVLMVSNYVDIVGVLLATIWSTRNKYPHAQPGFTVSGALSDFRTARGRSSSHFAVEE
ncbi:hypothetical protein GSI_12149 [Ganoderma sinense ZZ0214-1]|uniref:Uncharacterized protein n=1 Tax=Ganoderma sinense ZZ0214-1 TaxID=1077348 RepID=A0A2G8RY08_9APHY|nr:hypothetical protein GSI_12149 [Ganoderma sinense ZZ0214-1]